MFRKIFLVLALVVLGFITPARAADSVLNVEVDRGELVRLDQPANSVFIANPDIADIQVLSPTRVMVFGKKIGETTLMAVGDGNTVLAEDRVRVTMNLAGIQHALDTMIPGHNISVEAIPNGLMLTGTVKDAMAAEDARRAALTYLPKESTVINRLQLESSNQINLRVRVAEVSRDLNKKFGINWNNAFKVSGFAFGITQGAPLLMSGMMGLNSSRPNDTNIFSGKYSNSGLDINGFVDALADDGLITILAEPNLTAMSGETAFFLAGGEYPILVPQSNGSVSIEYKDYGVKLSFTPTLLAGDRINLKVRPEVSELSSEGAVTLNNYQIPSLRVRRAETTVELGSGQSFAIAGLLSNNQNQSIKKFPGLGDVPVLGALFRSTDFQNNQSELVIIVTPYLVRPVSEQQLAAPTDGYSPPSDMDRLIYLRNVASGKTSRDVTGQPVAVKAATPPVRPSSASPLAVGDGGFVVE